MYAMYYTATIQAVSYGFVGRSLKSTVKVCHNLEYLLLIHSFILHGAFAPPPLPPPKKKFKIGPVSVVTTVCVQMSIMGTHETFVSNCTMEMMLKSGDTLRFLKTFVRRPASYFSARISEGNRLTAFRDGRARPFRTKFI
jgi:hypothetical protein